MNQRPTKVLQGVVLSEVPAFGQQKKWRSGPPVVTKESMVLSLTAGAAQGSSNQLGGHIEKDLQSYMPLTNGSQVWGTMFHTGG